MDFLRYKLIYLSFSGILVIGGIMALILWGLNLGIDFTGGTLIEYQFEQLPDLGLIRQTLTNNLDFDLAGLQTAENNYLIVRTPEITQEHARVIKQVLEENFNQSIREDRFESIGPTLGKELLIKTLIAIVITATFIMGYVAWTFKNLQYGVSAILAMFHDSLILIGSFSVLGHFLGVEVDTLFVTAVLTTLSFSVHDTVVVYDRIRESIKQYPQVSFVELSNKALTETMGRSINNSLTIIFMLVALLILGGSTIKWFVVSLLIGTIAGTYSSPFVAVPLLNIWQNFKSRISHR